MFRSLIIAILFSFWLSGLLNAQIVPVPQTSVPVIMKTSASWCSVCGGFGWSFFQSMLDDHQDHAVVIAGHISGDFNSVAATQIGSNFGVFGHPTFLLNGVNKGVNSGNANSKRTEIANDVQTISNSSPGVQLGIDANFSGNQLVINYSLKAFSDLTGDHHVAFYLAEKTKVGQQTPIGSQAVHKNLLRHELNANTFGNRVFTGNTPAGSVYDGNFSVALGNYSPENIDIIGIIWKASGSSFQIVNANVDKTVGQTTNSLDTTLPEASFRVFPTVVSRFATIEVGSDISLPASEIYITDFSGRTIGRVFSGDLSAGRNNFTITRSAFGYPGTYLVIFRSGELIRTTRLVIE